MAQKMSPLALRIVSAAVLVPLVLAAVWAGAIFFSGLCFIVAALILREWRQLTGAPPGALEALLLVTGLALAAALAHYGLTGSAVLLIIAQAAASALFPAPVSSWRGGGVLYAGLPLIALIALRGVDGTGLAAVIVLLVMVWATDIAAYAAGRLIGGPKLWPRVSPSKTWAGLLGAVAASAGAGAAAASWLDASVPMLALLGGLVAIIAQAGDFLESAVKRRFGAKDSGTVIPGHGGIMDRVDGLVAAAVFAALLGAVHAGPEASARGFLMW